MDGYKAPIGRAHEIVLRGDGTCDFRSITEFGHKVDFHETTGRWVLAHDVGLPDERKRKNEVEIRAKDRGLSFYLTEEHGKILLWYYWGDPDEGTLIRYAKNG